MLSYGHGTFSQESRVIFPNGSTVIDPWPVTQVDLDFGRKILGRISPTGCGLILVCLTRHLSPRYSDYRAVKTLSLALYLLRGKPSK